MNVSLMVFLLLLFFYQHSSAETVWVLQSWLPTVCCTEGLLGLTMCVCVCVCVRACVRACVRVGVGVSASSVGGYTYA